MLHEYFYFAEYILNFRLGIKHLHYYNVQKL